MESLPLVLIIVAAILVFIYLVNRKTWNETRRWRHIATIFIVLFTISFVFNILEIIGFSID